MQLTEEQYRRYRKRKREFENGGPFQEIHFLVPVDQAREWSDFAKQRGISRSALLHEAMETYLRQAWADLVNGLTGETENTDA